MRIRLAFPATAQCRTKRGTYKTAFYTDTIEADIPELSSPDVPKAMLVLGGGVEKATSYFGFDGRLYRKCEPKVRLLDDHPLALPTFPSDHPVYEAFEARALGVGKRIWDTHMSKSAGHVHPPAAADLLRMRFALALKRDVILPRREEMDVTLDEADAEDERRRFQAHVSEFIFRDGVLLRAAPEPVFIADLTQRDTYAPRVRIVFPDRALPLHKLWASERERQFFRIDGYEDALEAVAARLGRPSGDDPASSGVTVYDTTHLSFDAERTSLALAAERALNAAQKWINDARSAHEGPTEYDKQAMLRVLARMPSGLPTMCRRLLDNIEDGDGEELAAALTAAAQMRLEDGIAPFRWRSEGEDTIAIALDRWNSRPITMNDTPTMSLGGVFTGR